MLTVHRFEEPYSIHLRIEGALTGEGLATVTRSWDTTISIAHGRKLRLDASGITGADDAGIAFLAHLRQAGAHVDDDGRFLPVHEGPRLAVRLRQRLCGALCAAVPTLHGCPCRQRS